MYKCQVSTKSQKLVDDGSLINYVGRRITWPMKKKLAYNWEKCFRSWFEAMSSHNMHTTSSTVMFRDKARQHLNLLLLNTHHTVMYVV